MNRFARKSLAQSVKQHPRTEVKNEWKSQYFKYVITVKKESWRLSRAHRMLFPFTFIMFEIVFIFYVFVYIFIWNPHRIQHFYVYIQLVDVWCFVLVDLSIFTLFTSNFGNLKREKRNPDSLNWQLNVMFIRNFPDKTHNHLNNTNNSSQSSCKRLLFHTILRQTNIKWQTHAFSQNVANNREKIIVTPTINRQMLYPNLKCVQCCVFKVKMMVVVCYV